MLKYKIIIFVQIIAVPFNLMYATMATTDPEIPCTSEQYYDSGLRECVYCAVLCTKAEARGQLAECLTFCPDYMKSRLTTTPSRPPAKNRSETRNNKDIHCSLLQDHVTGMGVAVIMVNLGMISVVSLLLVCLILDTRRQLLIQRPGTLKENNLID
ncbi:hypothetical protein SNE40_011054 [Patella caerulea]|uniref:TNFR-Cys domain-containing protein n=1 Tax=Patella caerulea TaxID=87958 RepID=A0AAN8JW77_PATCE